MFRRTVLAFSLFAASIGALSLSASPVSAASVGTGACASTVDNAADVTATLSSAGACIVTFATASTSPTTSTQYATRSWTVPAGITSVDVLVVAGGGGGGMSNGSTPTGGGGGGGGIVVATNYTVTPGASVTVKSGYGGQGGNCAPGNPGGNSAFGLLVAAGGGQGGGCGPAFGGPGGSAGGAHWGQAQGLAGQSTLGTPSNGTNITAYGTNGGKSYPHGQSGDSVSAGGGGGGGATTAGGDATQPGANSSSGVGGDGGEGLANNWRTGSNIVYGSGGGGQARAVQGVGGTNGGTASGTNSAGGAGIDAVDETGAGGGGGYRQGGGRAGDGGSGIVIVRYFVDTTPTNSSSPTISGTTTNGQTLTGARGSWSGYPTPTYSYQWKRASSAAGSYSNISNATSLTYTLTDNDINQYIKFAVTATNSSGSTTELSAASAQIADMFRPTTTTTTTTTLPTVNIVISAPTTTVAIGQASVATIASTTSTVPKVMQKSNASTTTSTVVPGTTLPKAPTAAPVKTGEAAVSLGGSKAASTLSRENNQIVVRAGDVTAMLGGIDNEGKNVALDADGSLRMMPGQKVRIKLNGFQPGSIVDAWLFSTPYHLGSAKVDAAGVASAEFVLRKDVPTGAHRISVLARLRNGKPAQFTLGIAIGSYKKEANMALWMIITPVVLAVGLALFLPAAYRRRKKSPAA